MLGPFEDGRVYEGDCLIHIPELPDNSITLLWTDPPYGHNNNNGDLIHNWEAALGLVKAGAVKETGAARPIANDGAEATPLLEAMLKAITPKMRLDCCCCCCCGGGGPEPQFARWSLLLDQKPWQFFHMVVWDKGGLGMGWRYRRNYETVLVAHLRSGRLAWSWEGSGAETSNVVRLGKVLPSADQHPTPKPVELVEHFLRLHTQPGDWVVDPFAGAGTTGVACRRLGRRFVGFEIDPHWASIANRRLGVTCSSYGTPLFGAAS